MWVFGRTTADSTSATEVTAPASIQSASSLFDPGVWTQVTGVYDGAHHQLLLYVNGVRQVGQGDTAADDITFDTPWQATGTFAIGRGRTSSGSYGDYTTGLVDDVRVWAGVMALPDVNQMYVTEYNAFAPI